MKLPLSSLSALLLTSIVACGPDDYDPSFEDADFVDTTAQGLTSYTRTRWVSRVSDGLRLRDMSIPGTHDSGSYNFSGAGKNWKNTQRSDIREQLDSGIRFLDLRAGCHGTSELRIVHGSQYTNLDFGTHALDSIQDFLNDNPTEFVLARIMKQGNSCSDYASRFNTYLTNYRTAHGGMAAGEIATGSTYYDSGRGLKTSLTKGQVKGKFIVLVQYMGAPNWSNATAYYSNTDKTQHDDTPRGTAHRAKKRKRSAVSSHFSDLASTTNSDFWIVYLNASKWNCTPACFAESLNPHTHRLLENRSGRTGIVVMDFESTYDELVDRVISKNPNRP